MSVAKGKKEEIKYLSNGRKGKEEYSPEDRNNNMLKGEELKASLDKRNEEYSQRRRMKNIFRAQKGEEYLHRRMIMSMSSQEDDDEYILTG